MHTSNMYAPHRWAAAMVALLLMLSQVRGQRPLNANGTLFGVDSSTIRPTLRGYSLFDGGHALATINGAGAGSHGPNGNGAAGDGSSSQQALATIRKFQPTSLNALHVPRPSNAGGGSSGSGSGTFGVGGANGVGGEGAQSMGGGGMNTLNVRRKQKSNGGLGETMIGSGGAVMGAVNGGGGGGVGSISILSSQNTQAGRGRKHTFTDLRKNLNAQRVRDRPNDEATPPVYGGYDNTKNPMYVLKERFRNDSQISQHLMLNQHHSDSDSMEDVLGVKCNFETNCAWMWDEVVIDGFQTVTGANLTESNRTGMMPGPAADRRHDANGHFLYLRLTPQTGQRTLSSPAFSVTQPLCYLEMAVHQSGMQQNSMRIVIRPLSGNPWVLSEVTGNDYHTWEVARYRIGRVSQDFQILFEVVPNTQLADDEMRPGHVAIDDLTLRDCFPELAPNDACQMAQVRCEKNRLERCLRTVQVCDVDVDCDMREDEQLNCDKIPFGGRCDFEDGWCGWQNSGRAVMQWDRHSGPTPTEKTGPDADHTLQGVHNGTQGHYMFVNMNQHANDEVMKRYVGFASNAVMNSVVFNPPPMVSFDRSSPYTNSCMVRFYVHQFGPNPGSLNLSVVEIGERENVTTTLWWSSRNRGPEWQRENLIMPNITGRYFLQFEARMGMRIFSDVAIDDFSLSPECFGLNIPVDDLNGYNYYDPKLFDNRPVHRDFRNRSVVSLTTCGARGKNGPRPDQCKSAYNLTNMQTSIRLIADPPYRGVQVWTVPNENYYTIIVKGAGGGLGSGGVGSSRGARAVSVLELHKDEEIHFLIGQKGEHACIKSMGYREKECEPQPEPVVSETALTTTGQQSKTKLVHHMHVEDGAGGGGGATFVFVLNQLQVAVPLVVAAGGGGLGIGRYLDGHEQHGRPPTGVPDDQYSGQVEGDANVTGGAGGGWQAAPFQAADSQHVGAAMWQGGRGGEPCYPRRGIHGQGGFGGGGGGCQTGGGGGGYAGGDSDDKQSNGVGGTSYISRSRSVMHLSAVSEGENSGPGGVVIIPALVTPACGCDYRCVVLDEYRSVVACLCPENWRLKKDNLTACEQINKPSERAEDSVYNLILLFLVVCVLLVFALAWLIFILYNRYQRKKQAAIRQKMLMEQDLQLARLRNHPDEHNLNAFNPNYGCDSLLSSRVDVRSLPQVTREKLSMHTVLGRGAFGEVYEGTYRYRDTDIPMAVAVKMLPSMSTKCSEEEFVMEASIMAKFSHPNIVHLIGVCFDRHPRYLVIELLAGGDLKKWLRESRDGEGLSMKDLMFCALDVAKGCRYMESRRFIHRDIAARNCLLSSKGPGRVVKIADFGMARDIYRQDYYKKGGRAMLPIKWMPPEAFLDGIFTAKTDVWSYGVLMWEIFSQGILPYASMANAPVMKYVTNNFRLPQPEGCPDEIYALMQATWSMLPEDRPSFAVIIDQIVACTMDGEVMNAPLPEFMRVLKMMGDNGTVLNLPYNPDECERPEVENAEDDPQDYLVPLDAQRRRAAVAHAAAVAAARIGPNQPPMTTAMAMAAASTAHTAPMSSDGASVHKSVSAVTMATTLLPATTPNGLGLGMSMGLGLGIDVPFICSDPHCTNTNHILPPTVGSSTTLDASGASVGDAGSLETSFSVPKSVSNPGDLLPAPPPPAPSAVSAAAKAAAEEAAAEEAAELAQQMATAAADRKLINLDTPQATPTAIKPPMAFGDRDSSCNSIATISLDVANLEQQQQHMVAASSPYMNVSLQLHLDHQQQEQQRKNEEAQRRHKVHNHQQHQPKLSQANGYVRHNGDGRDADVPKADALNDGESVELTALPQPQVAKSAPEEQLNGAVDSKMVVACEAPKSGTVQPFTIHGYSKRYKPNENHSEISC